MKILMYSLLLISLSGCWCTVKPIPFDIGTELMEPVKPLVHIEVAKK